MAGHATLPPLTSLPVLLGLVVITQAFRFSPPGTPPATACARSEVPHTRRPASTFAARATADRLRRTSGVRASQIVDRPSGAWRAPPCRC